jgi:hypothetical protein
LGVCNKGVGERIGAMELVGIWVRLMLLMSMVMLVFGGIETPTYTVVHLESDFEIRLLRPTVWVSASVDDISFNQATQCGVHRLCICLLSPGPCCLSVCLSLHRNIKKICSNAQNLQMLFHDFSLSLAAWKKSLHVWPKFGL